MTGRLRQDLRDVGFADPDDVMRRYPHELSGGMRQRVLVTMAFSKRPELVIADEPTSALDADAREAFLNLLFVECQAAGSSLLFVSHDGALERLFDRSLSLSELNRATPDGGLD